MQTRIGQVRIRYRVTAGQMAAATLASLQSVAQQKIADSCDRAIANAFEDDPTVYVLRRVTSRVAVLAKQPTSDERLAEQWGRYLCTSVVRTIVRNDDDDNLVRFCDQAQFVSSFLTRLALGDAWNHWYFGAFNNYRSLPPPEIVISVLEDNHEIAPQILNRLQQSNALDNLLKLLGTTGQRHLWEKVIRTAPIDNQTVEAFRIFAQAAFSIADLLSLWHRERPQESEVIESYLRTTPPMPNWTNSLSLADAVGSLLRFMVQRQFLDVSITPTVDQVAELRDAMALKLDWLDTSHLFQAVLSLFEVQQFLSTTRQFTLRPQKATPAQNRILDELLLRLQLRNISLSTNALQTHENLLRIVAAISESTELSLTASIAGLLESILLSALAIESTRNPSQALGQLRRGELSSIVSFESKVTGHFKAVIEAGKSAQALLAEVVQRSLEMDHDDGAQVHSECAGLFLLVRIVQDLRLSGKVKECGSASIEPLLAGLAIAICEQYAWSSGSFDPGAAVWAGFDSNEVFDALDQFDWEQFTIELLETAIAQRLIDPAETTASLESFTDGPYSDETAASLDHVGALLIKAWGRWLPGLAHSSTNYLLDNFIRRAGTIIVGEHRIIVELERRPLDEILKLAGYLAETPPVAWLQNRTVRYRFAN